MTQSYASLVIVSELVSGFFTRWGKQNSQNSDDAGRGYLDEERKQRVPVLSYLTVKVDTKITTSECILDQILGKKLNVR
jgi:hypothetical protein